MAGTSDPTLRRSPASGLIGLLVLHLVLVMPVWPEEHVPSAFFRLPLELPILFLVLTLPPPALRPWVIRLTAAVVVALAVVKLADLAIYEAYARPFNAFLHLHLIPAGIQLLAGAVGAVPAALLLTAGLLLALAMAAGMVWAVRAVAGAFAGSALPVRVVLAGALLTAYFGFDAADLRLHGEPVAVAQSSSVVRDEVVSHWQTAGDLARFREEMSASAALPPSSGPPLSRLGKADVLLVFVESYGRAAIENPAYAAETGRVLADFDGVLHQAGFAARSAWLASSTYGGQSWLAHSTLLSGLRIDSQGRYDALMLSGRPTLVHDFRNAGWSTVAVVPGITATWPEAAFFGYRRVHAAADLGYRGQPFGWIPMPDQFTLSAFDRLELATADRPPLMATIILLSSHVPWTPLPVLLPWDRIGDGSAFDAQARTGDPPEVVWASADHIRAQYGRSIAYVLRTLSEYVARHQGDNLVLIVLGDHQPVPFVSGEPSRPDVPVHIIARDPAVLATMDGWGWTHAMKPDPAAPVWPMESLRARLLAAMTPEAAPAPPPREEADDVRPLH